MNKGFGIEHFSASALNAHRIGDAMDQLVRNASKKHPRDGSGNGSSGNPLPVNK